MKKFRKAKSNLKRSKPYEMTDDAETPVEASKNFIKTISESAEDTETSHTMFKRHTAEWKKMKHEVALLKVKKAKLRNKVISEREEKRNISKRIKALKTFLKEKHLDEEKNLKEKTESIMQT